MFSCLHVLHVLLPVGGVGVAVDWGLSVEEVCIDSMLDMELGTGVDVPVDELNGNFLAVNMYIRMCMYTPTSYCHTYGTVAG